MKSISYSFSAGHSFLQLPNLKSPPAMTCIDFMNHQPTAGAASNSQIWVSDQFKKRRLRQKAIQYLQAMIWIPSASEAWEPVQVVSNDSTSVTVRRMNGGSEFKVPGALTSFGSVTVGALEENCENLVDLESYNEGIILHHTKKRFSQDKIYTYVGNILVALNPYKPLDIYSLSVIERIYNSVKQRDDVPPHIFSIAANAVFCMKQDSKNQAVLISGEYVAGILYNILTN